MQGIKSGMVMQRNGENVCDILLRCPAPITEISYRGPKNGTARLEKYQDTRYRVTGIPVGGPYQLQINGVAYTDIYVGDVWILAGQSNMQGVGWLTPEDRTFPGCPEVRALYMEDCWRPARHPLHTEWKAVDKVHTAVLGAKPPDTDFQGVGPGLSFGLRMHALTGVPQGLLCCAHGGTSLAQWSPDKKMGGSGRSLYAAMARRVFDNGGHVGGMFWYQGCAEAFENKGAVFENLTEAFIRECRRDLGYPFDGEPLPFVQVQLGRVVHQKLPGLEENWTLIRESQRRLAQRLPWVFTLSSINERLDDCIHLSGSSQKRLGIQAAECMYYARYCRKEPDSLPPPSYRSCRLYRHPISGWAAIEVVFDHLVGKLISAGRPAGFSLAPAGQLPDTDMVYDVSLSGNRALLRLHYQPEDIRGYVLYYGYGLNPYCNLTDERGRSVPCFGPVPLDDNIE